MKELTMKSVCRWGKAAALSALVATPAWADDTDIYTSTGTVTGGIVRVMLTLDLGANSNATYCSDASNASCAEEMGDELYEYMDLFNAWGEEVADGLLDWEQPYDPDDEWYLSYPGDPWAPGHSWVSGENGFQTVAQAKWSGEEVNLFDVIRTVIRVSINKIGVTAAENSDTVAGVEVGLMVNHESGSSNNGCGRRDGAGPGAISASCSTGAYVLQGFTDITTAEGRQAIFDKLGRIVEVDVKPPWSNNSTNGHAFSMRDIYLEYYRYVTGKDVFNGFLGFGDYNSQIDTGNLYQIEPTNDVVMRVPYVDPVDDAMVAGVAPDPNAMNPGTFDLTGEPEDLDDAEYVSPLKEGEECSALFVVNTIDGEPAAPLASQGSLESTDGAFQEEPDAGGLSLSMNGNSNRNDIEVLSALYGTDLGSSTFLGYDISGEQNVTSYFLARQNQQVNDLAAAGGTGSAFELDDPQEMLDTWDFIWGEILSVSTTFVAASVPVNVFNRAEAVDNLYFAIFKAENEVRWSGNVKKLKIATVNDPDSAGYDETEPTYDIIAEAPLTDPPSPAISAADGRIRTDALTFWTDPAGRDVVAFDPDPLSGEVSGKDGRSVTRGGAGQQIPGYLNDAVGENNAATNARQVFTQDPSLATTNKLLGLDSTEEMASLSPYLDPNEILDATQEQDLVGWIRGLDADTRWLMADPIHSRPLLINYGDSDGNAGNYSRSNPDIRLFFGTNDGFFHVVRNTVSDTDGTESGEENFAFIPLELLEMQSTLRANGQQSIEPHPYGMDGEAVSYVVDGNSDGSITTGDSSGDSAWVYIGMRRGGRGIYSFDMTDPDAPVFKWKINSDTDGFEKLAMTFSTPVVAEIDLNGDEVLTPVLIFAAGYNGGWKKDGTSDRIGKDVDGNRDPDTIGNTIYVVDADDGSLLWTAVDSSGNPHPDMLHSIPSTISVLDTNGNGIADRGYVGDAGGNIWRIELVEADAGTNPGTADDTGGPDDWYVTRLASLATNANTDDIRFFHAPDVALTRDAAGDYDAVVITAGNRADPLDTVVDNFAYVLKDRCTTPGVTNDACNADDANWPMASSDLVDITDLCVSGTEPDCLSANLINGWKLKLEAGGEKGLSKPLVANGLVVFTTYSPVGGAQNECGPSEGEGYVYVTNLANGSVKFNLDTDADQDEDKTDRFTDIGPGIPAGVIVVDADKILVPGKGIPPGTGGGDDPNEPPCYGQFCSPGGESLWKIYWREEGVDRL